MTGSRNHFNEISNIDWGDRPWYFSVFGEVVCLLVIEGPSLTVFLMRRFLLIVLLGLRHILLCIPFDLQKQETEKTCSWSRFQLRQRKKRGLTEHQEKWFGKLLFSLMFAPLNLCELLITGIWFIPPPHHGKYQISCAIELPHNYQYDSVRLQCRSIQYVQSCIIQCVNVNFMVTHLLQRKLIKYKAKKKKKWRGSFSVEVPNTERAQIDPKDHRNTNAEKHEQTAARIQMFSVKDEVSVA